MNSAWVSRLATVLAAIGLAVAAAGCRSLPIPIEIDLLAHLGGERSGIVEESVRSGIVPELVLDLPQEADACIDVDEQPVVLVHARLQYALDVRYEGPALAGIVEVQPYLAPSAATRWNDESALGDPITVDLASARAALAGTVELTPAQVAGLNQGRVCWGLRLRGSGVEAAADGTLRAAYDVRTLRARAGVAVF
jgi:hypothetical protein